MTVVLNPQAGRGLALHSWPRLQEALKAHQLPFELIQEATGAQALARVQETPPEQPVLAVGGDGTIAALLPAVVGTGRPLAIVPLGTGNDYAGMLGLRPGTFDEALGRLRYVPRRVDALEAQFVDGEGVPEARFVLNGLGMGFDAEVSLKLREAPGWLSGFGRYLWSALACWRTLKLHEVEVEVDGARLYNGPSCLAAVMNGTRYGGGFMISPASDAHDGRLNVVVSGPVGRGQWLSLTAKVLRGRHLGHPKVHHAVGEQVLVRWQTPTPLHLDGEVSGLVQELRARLLPGAVCLLNG